jgi:hypothetical protein
LGSELSIVGDGLSTLVVLVNDGVRVRIRLTRLCIDESGDLVPAPLVEILVREDLKSAHVVRYEDEIVLRAPYCNESDDPPLHGNRLIGRLVESFLGELLAFGSPVGEFSATDLKPSLAVMWRQLF